MVRGQNEEGVEKLVEKKKEGKSERRSYVRLWACQITV
jgi:hypothetical protein